MPDGLKRRQVNDPDALEKNTLFCLKILTYVCQQLINYPDVPFHVSTHNP